MTIRMVATETHTRVVAASSSFNGATGLAFVVVVYLLVPRDDQFNSDYPVTC
jgi:hypothetical protein